MKEWEKLFKNDLFYASPIIKLAYQKMAFCAEKFGDKEKATIFQNEAEKVNPFLDIDFEYYQYFGWQRFVLIVNKGDILFELDSSYENQQLGNLKELKILYQNEENELLTLLKLLDKISIKMLPVDAEKIN